MEHVSGDTHLEFKPMLFPTVLLDPRIHVFHQGVPLHQHVGEGGAGEDADDLGAHRRQILQAASEDIVYGLLIHSGRLDSIFFWSAVIH